MRESTLGFNFVYVLVSDTPGRYAQSTGSRIPATDPLWLLRQSIEIPLPAAVKDLPFGSCKTKMLHYARLYHRTLMLVEFNLPH